MLGESLLWISGIELCYGLIIMIGIILLWGIVISFLVIWFLSI